MRTYYVHVGGGSSEVKIVGDDVTDAIKRSAPSLNRIDAGNGDHLIGDEGGVRILDIEEAPTFAPGHSGVTAYPIEVNIRSLGLGLRGKERVRKVYIREEETGPGRPEIGPAFTVRLPADLTARLDERAKENGASRAELIRQAVTQMLNA